jgi:hypothetical protein
MSEGAKQATEIVNYVFTIVFVIEAIIKIIAFGCRYFKDTWNVFDFSIVAGSLVFILMQQTLGIGFSTTTQVVRSLRISRMFKLFRNLKQLQIIFTTFYNTLSSLLNVGSLMFLIIYIYAVIGIVLFADVKLTWPMHERLNF